MILPDSKTAKMNIVYFGMNSFRQHKRGVENVIDFQAKSCDFNLIYYFHWGAETGVYKHEKFICISIKHKWHYLFILNLILIKIGRRHKFILHVHNPLFAVASVIKPDIYTVHDGIYYLAKHAKSKVKFFLGIVEALLYRRSSVVHFISNFTKQNSLFGERKNFVVIPNTSHFEKFVPVAPVSKNTSFQNVLVVRSIEERARFDLLLSVAEKLKDTNLRFTVAGKGPLLDFYKRAIAERSLPNITMSGYVDDETLLKLYANSDVVLNIAEYGEGFGLPVIEGYLFNKPVIASDKCAIPEVIISKEFLFENSTQGIVDKLAFAEHLPEINFREYYDLKYSNAVIQQQMRNLILSLV